MSSENRYCSIVTAGDSNLVVEALVPQGVGEANMSGDESIDVVWDIIPLAQVSDTQA